MLQIVFFARVKEQLGCAKLEMEWDETLDTVQALQERLCDREGGSWREVLSEDNLIRALNQTVITTDAALSDGDEIAFFPPVTGG